jgi:hypothetical protein
MAILPKCLALVPCDEVRTDPTGRRLTIYGAFHYFVVHELPAVGEPFVIWCQITDCKGDVTLRVAFEFLRHDAPDVELLWHAGRRIPNGDPRTIHDYRPTVPRVVLAQRGEYRISLIANEQPILQRTFVLIEE